MQAKAHVSIPKHVGNTSHKKGPTSLWSKLTGFFVMDAPPTWDVHPDVLRKLDEREQGIASFSSR
jgi:hypothetical protein